MPILSGDVKLLKSAKMADALEDGGGLAGLQIAQGVSNRFFGKQEGLRGVLPGEEKPSAGPEEKPPRGGGREAGDGSAGGAEPLTAPRLPIQALSSRGSSPNLEFMSRVGELSDVREESCSLPELSDFHGA